LRKLCHDLQYRAMLLPRKSSGCPSGCNVEILWSYCLVNSNNFTAWCHRSPQTPTSRISSKRNTQILTGVGVGHGKCGDLEHKTVISLKRGKMEHKLLLTACINSLPKCRPMTLNNLKTIIHVFLYQGYVQIVQSFAEFLLSLDRTRLCNTAASAWLANV